MTLTSLLTSSGPRLAPDQFQHGLFWQSGEVVVGTLQIKDTARTRLGPILAAAYDNTTYVSVTGAQGPYYGLLRNPFFRDGSELIHPELPHPVLLAQKFNLQTGASQSHPIGLKLFFPNDVSGADNTKTLAGWPSLLTDSVVLPKYLAIHERTQFADFSDELPPLILAAIQAGYYDPNLAVDVDFETTQPLDLTALSGAEIYGLPEEPFRQFHSALAP